MTTVTIAANRKLIELEPGSVFKLRGRYWMVMRISGDYPGSPKYVIDLNTGEPKQFPEETEVQFFPEARLAGVL